MAFETFVLYIVIAFMVGFVTGMFMIAAGSGSRHMTREESRRVDQIIDEIGKHPRSTLTLWSEGKLIDSVNIGEERW